MADPRGLVLTVGLVGLVVWALVVQLSGLTGRPDGYYLDESSFSWNAWTIATLGVDEHGRPWPIFFEAFGDWKTGPYIYSLAAVFAVTGPSIEAARALSALSGIATVALLGWLGYRAGRRLEIGLLAGATALLMPWTLEPTRLAMEVALMPALVALFLVILHERPPSGSRVSMVLLGLSLGLITYTYTLGRLLGPLLALALIVYVARSGWRGVLGTWLVYGLLLVPFAVFYVTDPNALTVRLSEAGYLSRPVPDVVVTFVQQILGNIDPAVLLLTSDPNERHHAQGIMGSLLVGTFVLAILGIVRTALRARTDPWSAYLLLGLVAALIPASLTLGTFHVHRLIAVPIFLVALSIPAQVWLLVAGRWGSLRRWAFGLLAVATLAQGAWFQVRYDEVARHRGGWFDADYPRLLDAALATDADPIYLEDGVVPGYVHGYWYGALAGVPPDRFVHLPPDTRAPSGAVVLSSVPDCRPCEDLETGGFFRLYRVP